MLNLAELHANATEAKVPKRPSIKQRKQKLLAFLSGINKRKWNPVTFCSVSSPCVMFLLAFLFVVDRAIRASQCKVDNRTMCGLQMGRRLGLQQDYYLQQVLFIIFFALVFSENHDFI